jgi:hypothetical protein
MGSTGVQTSTAMASSSLAFPYKQTRAHEIWALRWCPCIQRRSREGEGRSTATFTLAVDLPEALRAPVTVLLWLGIGCEVERMSRSEGVEWGVNGRQEEVSRGASS